MMAQIIIWRQTRMRRLLLMLMIGLLAVSIGCTSSSDDEVELTGDEVVQLVFFWSDT